MNYLVCIFFVISASAVAGQHNSFRSQSREEMAQHILRSIPNTPEQREKNARAFIAVSQKKMSVVESLLANNANPACMLKTQQDGNILLTDMALIHLDMRTVNLLQSRSVPLPTHNALVKYCTAAMQISKHDVVELLLQHVDPVDEKICEKARELNDPKINALLKAAQRNTNQ